MHRATIAAFALVVLGNGVVGCTNYDDEADVAESDDALTGSRPSGVTQCPGLWNAGITEWKGVRGTYTRAGLAPAGEPQSLTVLDDWTANGKALRIKRTTSTGIETGHATFGVDNPAIGAVLAFAKGTTTTYDDLYWILAQRKTAAGKVTAICLQKAGDAQNPHPTNVVPFMVSRVGK